LKVEIDRLTAGINAKTSEWQAASGAKKVIVKREVAALSRPLKGYLGEDARLEARLLNVDSSMTAINESIAVKSTRTTDADREMLIDHKEEAIDREAEDREYTSELDDMAFENGAEEEQSMEDMLADIGIDLGTENTQEATAPEVERVPQREETVRPTDTTERISEGKRELDRLMAELDEEDD